MKNVNIVVRSLRILRLSLIYLKKWKKVNSQGVLCFLAQIFSQKSVLALEIEQKYVMISCLHFSISNYFIAKVKLLALAHYSLGL